MPTYQYACTDCGQRLEMVQAFRDEPLTQCVDCEGRLRKVFSPVGVVFKGSGFYCTDSRAAAKDRKVAKEGKPGSAPEGAIAKGDGDKSAGVLQPV